MSRSPTTTRVRVQIRSPRFLFVTVPTGRTPRATLEAAAAKAQDHILLHATLSPRSGNPTPTRPRSQRQAQGVGLAKSVRSHSSLFKSL